MSGGITQLVAIGAQDAHLVGDPQVSFFRSNYKRHTNFAHVVDRGTIQGNPVASGMSTVRFERKGDLLGYVYLTAVTTSGTATSVAIDADDIDKIEFLIGGQVIDTQDSNYSLHIGQHLGTSTAGKASVDTTLNPGMASLTYPLHFSFCENWQSAIPLVALQYHDVEIRIRWAAALPSFRRYSVHSSFIYLDTAEREELSNAPQDMLITQVQKSITSGSKIQELNFNHPVKFLAASSNLITAGRSMSSKLKLQVNGVDVGEDRVYAPHFNSTPFYFHCPYSLPATSNCSPGNGFLYPFCLETNKLQPTGTLNFSRLDSARLITNDASGIGVTTSIYTDVYGVNYNILRIQNGMGGLMYAN